jgi:hypothetical protein
MRLLEQPNLSLGTKCRGPESRGCREQPRICRFISCLVLALSFFSTGEPGGLETLSVQCTVL